MLVNVADEEVRLPFLHILASVLAWASAVINPFIYAFKNRQYQQAFAKVRFILMTSLARECLIKRAHLKKNVILHTNSIIQYFGVKSGFMCWVNSIIS